MGHGKVAEDRRKRGKGASKEAKLRLRGTWCAGRAGCALTMLVSIDRGVQARKVYVARRWTLTTAIRPSRCQQ